MIKHAKSPDHLIHTSKTQTKGKQEYIHGMNNADVCLNCTKKKCRGSRYCMTKRMAVV